jgi:hypothetical protein
MDGHRVDKVLVQPVSTQPLESEADDAPSTGATEKEESQNHNAPKKENGLKRASRSDPQKGNGSAARRDAQKASSKDGENTKNTRKENS